MDERKSFEKSEETGGSVKAEFPSASPEGTVNGASESGSELGTGADDREFEHTAKRFEKVLRAIAASFEGIPESERDDLVQEGLIALYRAFCSYKPGTAKFSTYAEVCIRRAMVSYLRSYNAKNHRIISLPEDDEMVTGIEASAESTASLGEDPESLYLSKESLRSLKRRALEQLSDYERCVFLLYLEGFESGEISGTLGKPQKSVDNALVRIRRKLSGKSRDGKSFLLQP